MEANDLDNLFTILTNTIQATRGKHKLHEDKKVLKALEDYKEGAMLVDIEIDKGFKVATGVITPLVNKGLVVATEIDRVSDIVYRETVIGHKTDHVKKYMLAKYVGLVEEKENVEENVKGEAE